MSTTSIFIELLITGLQSFIWLILFILCFFDFNWAIIERIKGFEVIIATIFLPIIYPIGILIDYVSDEVLRPWEIKIRNQYLKDSSQSAMRLLIEMKDQSLASHLSYIRNKIRISRSTTINFALITVSGFAFLLIRCRAMPGFPILRAIFLELIIGTAFTALSFVAWRRFNRAFFRWVAQFYNPDNSYNDEGPIDDKILETNLSA